MSHMRTTLTLDDDLAALLKERAASQGISFKQAVNAAIRSAFGQETLAPAGPPPRTIPHDFGFRPDVDLDKLNQLADDLEAEELAHRHRTKAP